MTAVTVFNHADLSCAALPAAMMSLGDSPDLLVPHEQGVAPGCFSVQIANAAYHRQLSYISHSTMVALLRSPAHLFAYLTKDRDESKPNLGTAAHCAVLEPAEFAQRYIVYSDRRQGKAWETFKADNADKVILSQAEMDSVSGMVEAIKSFDEFPLYKAIIGNEVEKSIFWTDEATGVGCRIRVDSLSPFVIFDLKSYTDSRPDAVARQIAAMDYDLQAYMYREGVRHFTGKTLPFIFAFVEDKKPHGVWLHTAGESVLANGRIKFQRGLRAFKALRESGNWHSYRNAMSVIELPRYAMITPDPSEEVGAAYY